MTAQPPIPPGPRWYCVRTRTKSEHVALGQLRRLADVDTYCPRIRYRKPTRRGPVWFTEALFPGYLFARFDLARSGRAVGYSAAVRGLVQFGNRPAPLPDGTIEALRRQVPDGEVRVFEESIQPGDTAEVLSGPFRGLEVVVTRMLPARDRVHILLDFLGRQTEAEVRVSDLVKRGRHPLQTGDAEHGERRP